MKHDLWTSYKMCHNLAVINRANGSKISPKTRSFSTQVKLSLTESASWEKDSVSNWLFMFILDLDSPQIRITATEHLQKIIYGTRERKYHPKSHFSTNRSLA